MLHQFTWQQFLAAAMILSLIWYGAVILLFYREQIQELLNGKNKTKQQTEPLAHAWDEDFEEEPADDQDGLIGKSTLPNGMSKVSMNMFGFAPDISENEVKADENKNWETEEDFENEQTDDNGRERQQSIIPDVLEELKSIFHILETGQGTKEDFISLFALVSSKYPNIKGTSNRQALNDYICHNVLFPISNEELDSLWA